MEVQALVSTSTYGNARRMANGVDGQRLSLLLAVLAMPEMVEWIAEARREPDDVEELEMEF